MHPILFSVGSFRVPTFGVLVALGFGAAVLTIVRLGRREGLAAAQLLDLSTWLILVGVVGAKVLMILTAWESYWENPRAIFSWATLQAAGVFYGGFVAAAFFALWYTRVYRMPVLKVFDVFSPAIALGHSIGRLGCFAAGCDYGKPTNSWLGVVFTDPTSQAFGGVPLGVRLHPAQIYESLATLAIFGILLWRYKSKKRDGEIFWLYLVLYGVARFFLEFLRGDEDRGFVLGHALSTSQAIALLALAAAAALAIFSRGRSSAQEVPAAALPRAKRARGF